VSDSFDLDAAGLRADRGDLAAGVEVLARKLEDALPRETTVERRAKRLLSRDKVVETIEVRLGVSRYALRAQGGEIEAERAQEVRGVVIKREQLGFDEWVTSLLAELGDAARGSADARTALDRLLG
jgi:hypothetical protein